MLVEELLLGEEGASAAFLCQILLHLTGEVERERENEGGEGERDERER